MSALLAERGEGAAQVGGVAAQLVRRGVYLGAHFSVGSWSPAADGYDWAVLDLRGDAVWLGYDAYEAAVRFLEYEIGAVQIQEDEPGLYPLRQVRDAYLAACDQWERWFYEGRFARVGDPDYDPPYPRREDYEP